MIPQISSAYSATVRSDENAPMREIVSSALRAQARRLVHSAAARCVRIGVGDEIGEVEVALVVGQQGVADRIEHAGLARARAGRM